LHTLAVPCISRQIFYKMLISYRSFVWQLYDMVFRFAPNFVSLFEVILITQSASLIKIS